jgi:hypothetical protein
MRTVEYKDLATEISKNPTKDKYICVFLWTPGCSYCDTTRSYIDKIEADNQDMFEWWSVEIDELPLFIPPALPYICLFWNGYRKWEGSGDPGENAFNKSMTWWRDQLTAWTKRIEEDPTLITTGTVPMPVRNP